MIDFFEALNIEKPTQPFRIEKSILYENDEEVCWVEDLVHPSGHSRAQIRTWTVSKRSN